MRISSCIEVAALWIALLLCHELNRMGCTLLKPDIHPNLIHCQYRATCIVTVWYIIALIAICPIMICTADLMFCLNLLEQSLGFFIDKFVTLIEYAHLKTSKSHYHSVKKIYYFICTI